MHRFTLGDATAAIINAGDIQYDLAGSLRVTECDWPDAYRSEFARPIHVPQQTTLIRFGRMTMLVDVGHPIMPPGCEAFAIPGDTPAPDVPTRLARLGVRAEDVTHVVITHAHFDHFDGVCDGRGEPCFPNARHYLGRADWKSDWVQAALRKADSLESGTLGVLMRRGLFHLVEGDHPVNDGVHIVAAPGETPGHQVVRVQSQGQTLYCVGDLYHHAVEVTHPGWQVHWADAAAMRVSRERFTGAALCEGASIVAAHIRGVGELAHDGRGVEWRTMNFLSDRASTKDDE